MSKDPRHGKWLQTKAPIQPTRILVAIMISIPLLLVGFKLVVSK